jgi:hypothetical protein
MNPQEKDRVPEGAERTLGRRELLTRAAPACALACLGLGRIPRLATAAVPCAAQGVHKFDVKKPLELSSRDATRMQNQGYIGFIKTLQTEVGDEETVRLLNANSAAVGRRAGQQQARRAPDTSFQSFTAQFRPPRYADALTHEIVEDTEHAFGLRVTECVWAAVFREAGLGGDLGHAAVCNMDYYWPPAFNSKFSMERDKTLMQGDDHCNHRYLAGE